jgi:hypothetical protein
MGTKKIEVFLRKHHCYLSYSKIRMYSFTLEKRWMIKEKKIERSLATFGVKEY